MLLVGTAALPFGYYTPLRWVVMVAALTTAYVCLKTDSPGWAMAGWVYVGIAVLFNPIVPFGFSRSTWFPIDLIVAAVMAAGTFASLPDGTTPRAEGDRPG